MRRISDYHIIIDTTGLRCPLPVLKVRKDLPILKKNNFALIIADDPLAEIDLQHFCNIKSYIISNVSSNHNDGRQYFEIQSKK